MRTLGPPERGDQLAEPVVRSLLEDLVASFAQQTRRIFAGAVEQATIAVQIAHCRPRRATRSRATTCAAANPMVSNSRLPDPRSNALFA